MIPVTSVKLMRDADEKAMRNGKAQSELMMQAARSLKAHIPAEGSVAIVCGGGNNGGDGLALAVQLAAENRQATVYMTQESKTDCSKHFASMLKNTCISVIPFTPESSLQGFATVVDCIFGTGFHGTVSGNSAAAIKAVNRSGAFVISADINSGLNGDTGIAENDCVVSSVTVSMGAFKTGHFLSQAKDFIKKLVYADIGVYPEACAYLTEKADLKNIFPPRRNFSNKSDYGYTALIGGSREYSGAAKLSALALSSLKSGAGVCRLALPESLVPAAAPYMLESTLFPVPDKNGAMLYNEKNMNSLLKGVRSVAVGMGMGQKGDNDKILRHILKQQNLIVTVDADALNTIARTPDIMKTRKAETVFTPHLGEFSRLTGRSVNEILSDPLFVAANYAAQTKVTLLLKGTTTIVTDGKETYLINTGTPAMSTGGSGDVLSGVAAGILGNSTLKGSTALKIAAAAWICGKAGEYAAAELGENSALPSDTIRYIPDVIHAALGR